MNEAVTGKSVQIWVFLIVTPGNKWKDIKAPPSAIFHLTPLNKSSLTLFFSHNPFGSQTGISPFLQPPPWYLRPLSYKLLCGLFRGITRLRIEDNWKEKIRRELTQHNRDQMWLFGSYKAGSWCGGLERMLYSHHNSAFIGRKRPGIFSWHICDLRCDWSMSHWDSLQWTKLFTDLHCSRPLYLDIKNKTLLRQAFDISINIKCLQRKLTRLFFLNIFYEHTLTGAVCMSSPDTNAHKLAKSCSY